MVRDTDSALGLITTLYRQLEDTQARLQEALKKVAELEKDAQPKTTKKSSGVSDGKGE